ncbi:glycosyltransferase family 4 protein [Clostridium perfringens]|nr:glycosyltransferase family 4 protein [Clostridium perfringens]
MRVLFLTNVPAPYRVDFFNELGKLCDLTVLYELKYALNRDERWKNNSERFFNEVNLDGIRIGNESALNFSVLKFLNNKEYDLIVIGGYSTPTGMLAIEYLRLKKIPFVLNCDGGFIKKDSFIKRVIKKHFIKSANYWLSTGKIANKYLIHYGAKKENIFIYSFTSLKKDDIVNDLLKKKEKESIKKELDVKNNKVLLFIGRFIYGKGIDILIKATKYLENDCDVYIIGGKPTVEYNDIIKENNIKNIFFEDFKTKEELEKYYKIADIFIFPTREDVWGLVINEAMSYGIPVITTNKCGAGLELIKNGINGFIMEDEDEFELANKIKYLLRNDEIIQNMRKNNLEKISEYTIENMAKEHFNIFSKILKDIKNE